MKKKIVNYFCQNLFFFDSPLNRDYVFEQIRLTSVRKVLKYSVFYSLSKMRHTVNVYPLLVLSFLRVFLSSSEIFRVLHPILGCSSTTCHVDSPSFVSPFKQKFINYGGIRPRSIKD